MFMKQPCCTLQNNPFYTQDGMTACNFEIRPPTTTGDDAQPSTSLLRDVRRIFALMQDERILAAHHLHQDVCRRLEEYKMHFSKDLSPTKRRKFSLRWAKNGETAASQVQYKEEYTAAQDILESKTKELDKLTKRAGVIERAKEKLENNEGWTLSQTLFGVTTYYKREDDNSLSLKLDGELSGIPLFEQVAVLREVDLHYKWSPFCTSSMTLQDLDKVDTVGWAVVGLPQFGFARDGCFRAFGCDCIMEEGNFFLVGQGVEDRPDNVPYDEPFFLEDLEGIQIPDPPTRLGSGRMTVRGFSAEVHVLSPTKVRTRIVANVNPNLTFIPQSLIDFVMKKMCGVVFSKLQHAAKKASADPVRNPHARRMRENEAFYKEWLMPKFQSYCDHVGWTMPPVPAFNLTQEQLQQAAGFNDAHPVHVPPVRSMTSIESSESAPSMNGNGVHPSASAPDLENAETDLQVQLSDSNSSVSSVSGASTKSFLRDNPISQYLREIEERTQKEKAKKIAEGRQQVAEQLRPRAITEDNYARLQQLKQAKTRRQRRVGSLSPRSHVAVATQTTKASTGSFADQLHTHGRPTRFTVTLILGIALLLTLHSDTLLSIDQMLRIHADSISMNVLLDIATIVYLGLSTAVFFVLSNVSLIYAFDSLSIGTKSGKRSKEFYRQTINSIVAGISGAIIVFSVGKAIAVVWFRVGLWYILRASQWAGNEFRHALEDQRNLTWFLDHAPPPIQSATAVILPHISPILRKFVGTGHAAVLFIQHWFVVIVIRSNFVGRAIAALTLRVAGILALVATAWEGYMSHVVSLHAEGDDTLTSWRGIVIDTARPLLEYTAVFLVSLLVLFNASSRIELSKREAKGTDTLSVSTHSDYFPSEPAATPTSMASSTAPRLRYQAISSISLQGDIIPEGEEDLSTGTTQSCATDFAVGSTDTARMTQFPPRRRKKKKVTDDGSIQSTISGILSKTQRGKMKKMETR